MGPGLAAGPHVLPPGRRMSGAKGCVLARRCRQQRSPTRPDLGGRGAPSPLVRSHHYHDLLLPQLLPKFELDTRATWRQPGSRCIPRCPARQPAGRAQRLGEMSSCALLRRVLEIAKLEEVVVFPLGCSPAQPQPHRSSQIHLHCCYLQFHPPSTSKASTLFPSTSLPTSPQPPALLQHPLSLLSRDLSFHNGIFLFPLSLRLPPRLSNFTVVFTCKFSVSEAGSWHQLFLALSSSSLFVRGLSQYWYKNNKEFFLARP